MCTRNDLAELKYLTMCIKESLRLHSPVSIIQRQIVNEITIDGVTLPPQSVIDIHIYNLHHNPVVWEDPMVRMQLLGCTVLACYRGFLCEVYDQTIL